MPVIQMFLLALKLEMLYISNHAGEHDRQVLIKSAPVLLSLQQKLALWMQSRNPLVLSDFWMLNRNSNNN